MILPNIRGSTTYGGDWIRPQLGDWGGVDAADVHSAVDHVISLGLVDADRIGVMGLSYGGFMTNWLVGTTDRFKAAVSENGVTNQINDWANSDGGPEFDRMSLMGDPFSAEGIERLWRQSPLRNVADVRTPLLMLQAEADHRCPAPDNEQFFIALRHLGRTVEYVLYPDEYHVYAAAGRPIGGSTGTVGSSTGSIATCAEVTPDLAALPPGTFRPPSRGPIPASPRLDRTGIIERMTRARAPAEPPRSSGSPRSEPSSSLPARRWPGPSSPRATRATTVTPRSRP